MAERIRVEVVRTGGLGGLTTRRSADTDALPEEEGRQLTALVQDLDLEALRPGPAATGRAVPDAFEYDVVISRGDTRVRVHARDPELPAQLRPLVRFVVQRT